MDAQHLISITYRSPINTEDGIVELHTEMAFSDWANSDVRGLPAFNVELYKEMTRKYVSTFANRPDAKHVKKPWSDGARRS